MAGNSKGFKHSVETIQKISEKAIGRKYTEKIKSLMSINRIGINNPFFGKTHSIETIEKLKNIANTRNYIPVKGIEVEIIDLETKITYTFTSIRECDKFLNSDIKTLLRRENTLKISGDNKPYINRYIINIKR